MAAEVSALSGHGVPLLGQCESDNTALSLSAPSTTMLGPEAASAYGA